MTTELRIGRPIGYGGSAAVWEAWRVLPDGTEQMVAVKRLLPVHRDNPMLTARFEREAALCMSITHNHPNLISVYEFQRMPDGDLMMIMEYVDGLSLDRFPQLDPPGVRYVMREVAHALEFVHGHGVLHRDISSRNILVTRDGTIKILDFGLARWLDAPRSEVGFQGTAPYASPEAFCGVALDPSADLYSLAAVCYELLTGEPPYGFGGRFQIRNRMAIRDILPLPDTVPRDLASVIEGLLKPWEDRAIRSASQVLDALDGPVAQPQDIAGMVVQGMESPRSEHERIDTYPERKSSKQTRKPRSRPARWIMGVCLVLSLAYLAHVALQPESETETGPAPGDEVATDGPVTVDSSTIARPVDVPVTKTNAVETADLDTPEESDTAEPSKRTEDREPSRKTERKVRRRVKQQPSKRKLLPSQQNPEIHVVPKADIYKNIEEED